MKQKKINTNDNDSKESISCVDLFCGVGGLTHGLIQGGIEIIAGVDVDSDCRFPYETNNEAIFIERDVNEMSAKELEKLFNQSDSEL